MLLTKDRIKRVYVAGPMTGLPDFNFPAFNAMADKMRSEGWHVENPAEHGHIEGAQWSDYLRSDIALLATCSAIVFLPGWSKSKGALLEFHIANQVGIEFIFSEGSEEYIPGLIESAGEHVECHLEKQIDILRIDLESSMIREAEKDGQISALKSGRDYAVNECKSTLSLLACAYKLLHRVIDSSVLSFEQEGPEELVSLEADICAALKPVAKNHGEPGSCNHEWTDDGAYLLVCTACGVQEDHNPGWRDMSTAPRDGTMLRLLVEFEEHSTEDADEAPTIGANNFDNDEVDEWKFSGWCWTHDHFVEGKGAPVGWLPMLDAPKVTNGTEQKRRRCNWCNKLEAEGEGS